MGISWKTHFLNQLRKPLKFPIFEALLVRITQGRSATGVWARVIPHPYLYKVGSLRTVMRHNSVFEVDISESIDWNIYYGLVHSRSWESFLTQLHAGDTVFDIGANVGEITFRIAQRVGNNGSVYSFEPQPQNFARLTRNLALNHYQNVRSQQLALGSSMGMISMAPRDSLNSGTQRIVEIDSPGKEPNLIPITTLDDFVEANQIERLDSLKIDVEGYEIEVLKGGIRTIRHFHPTILIEIVDRFLQERGGSARKLLQMLEDEGYQLVDAATSARVYSQMQSIPTMFDVLATFPGNQRQTR